ncbi:MAG: hypothetical protein J6X58_03860 [Bacteroidales bacterium]|nr:hypothetical protein [Bacteroidales bacterium]
MKKILFFAFTVLCGIATVKSQDIVNLRMDRQQMGLRGYVASMDEDILLRKDYFREDWPQRKWFVNDLRSVLREDNGRILTFNQSGRMLTITYTHQGKQGNTTRCVYAPNGLLTNYLGEGYKVEAKYSGNNADINVYAETRNFNANVNIASADLNTAAYTNSYPFDLKCRQELTDDGLVLNSKYYYVDSVLAKECEYNYNHINQLTSERTVDYSSGEKNVSITKYSYDNRGFLIKKTLHSKALDEICTYENNAIGDCIKMIVERPYGTVEYTFKYVYDDHLNWTVRLQFKDGLFDNAALRTLTYHAVSEKAKVEKESKAEKKSKVEKKKEPKQKEANKTQKKVKEPKPKKEAKSDAQNPEKKMTKEERKAAQEAKKAADKAEKERQTSIKKAEKERIAAEKQAEKERLNAEKKAEKERIAAEKQAEKERKAAEKKTKNK